MNPMKKEKKAKKEATKSKVGITRKEIRNMIQDTVNKAIANLHVGAPSKKTKKVVKKTSVKLAGRIRKDLKKKKTVKNPVSVAAPTV